MSTRPALAAFVALLALVALQRLVEAAVSARRARRRPGELVGEGWGFAAMVALHVALVVLPPLEVVLLDRRADWRVALPAALILGLATALRVWTLRTLGTAWNVRVVRPAADSIALDGPYRWVRHPNYVVVILEIAALPLVHSAWLSSIVLSALNALVLVRRIRVEEAVLGEIAAWRRAMAAVPRLLPRLPAWTTATRGPYIRRRGRDEERDG